MLTGSQVQIPQLNQTAPARSWPQRTMWRDERYLSKQPRGVERAEPAERGHNGGIFAGNAGSARRCAIGHRMNG